MCFHCDFVIEDTSKEPDEEHFKTNYYYALKALLKRQEQEKKDKLRLAHERKLRDETFACRRCSANFGSNTKLHKHVDEIHTQKPTVSTSSPSIAPKNPYGPLLLLLHLPFRQCSIVHLSTKSKSNLPLLHLLPLQNRRRQLHHLRKPLRKALYQHALVQLPDQPLSHLLEQLYHYLDIVLLHLH